MKKWIYVTTLGLIAGELLMFYGEIFYGLGVHIITLLAIILLIIFDNLSLEIKNILQSMMLLPILRIVSLSIPQLFEDIRIQYLLICGVMLIPIYSIIKNQQMLFKKSEINFGRLYIYLPIAILTLVITMMLRQYINIISNMQIFSSETISTAGEFAGIFLIISLSISLLISDTKYSNKYNSNTLDMCSYPLLLAFIAIVISKVLLTI